MKKPGKCSCGHTHKMGRQCMTITCHDEWQGDTYCVCLEFKATKKPTPSPSKRGKSIA